MKKLIYTLLFVLISVAANGQAKYVFYFIGDGMGVNQVNGTEMYQAERQNGRIGVEPLLFTQFPVATMATTFSATNSVTDSAAAGTALATGKKTYNSAISVEEGKDPSCLPYAIDRKSDDLTLAQITESAIDFLTKGKNKGFFLMVEGGKIDWACHANDAATVFNEVKDMDDAIKVAYEFYKKHPKETLIVVTADHETGGIVLGTGRYELNLKALQYQKHSADGLSKQISELRKSKGNKVTWEDMKEFLGNEMGFWKQFPISWEQEKKLRDEFEQSFVRNKVVFAESMYSKSEPMAARAKEVMDQISMVGWVSGGHSAGYVPVFAIGAGSQLFGEKIDNTEIPKRIAKAAGYK